jgi:hypothetical protein
VVLTPAVGSRLRGHVSMENR